MTKLSFTYRLLIFSLLCCISIESGMFFSPETQSTVDVEQQEDAQDTFLKATQPEAVIPVSTLHVIKWLYVIDLFSIENTVVVDKPIEVLHFVLSYFEVLFRVYIPINAP